jgi:hypothetical protein
MVEYVMSLVMVNSATKLGGFLVVSSFLLMISTSNLLPDKEREEVKGEGMYQKVDRIIFRVGWLVLFTGVIVFIIGLFG